MAGPGRNRCADLLRVLAIGAVVLGHWLLVDVTYRDGRLSGVAALDHVHWGRWLTLLFQVMPVFFLVGGFANAVSWTAHHGRGAGWTGWVRGRAMRLLWPATVVGEALGERSSGRGLPGEALRKGRRHAPACRPSGPRRQPASRCRPESTVHR